MDSTESTKTTREAGDGAADLGVAANVVNPAPDRASKARYSMPFFLNFRSDFLIEALPGTVPSGEQPKWPPITANEYLQERLREIKLV